VTDPVRRLPRGVWSLWPALAGVVVHFALREVLDRWLNASSDAKFWGAVGILALPLLFSVFAIYRAIVPPKSR
jgi:beta-lactamase regulating signal transducer with metallopeptidase domain